MSTATANPASSAAVAPGSSDRDRGDRMIRQHLEAARGALWRAALFGTVLRVVGILLAACLAFVIVDQWIWSFHTFGRVVLFVGGAGFALGWCLLRIVPLLRLRISPEYAAYSLEQDAPELRHALSSYVTLRPDRDAPGLRGIVVRSIGVRAARHLSSTGMAMPSEAGGTFKTAMIVVVVFAVLALYAAISPKNTLQSFARLMLPFSAIDPPTRVAISDVTPGDTETLFGRPLKITARIQGLLGSDSPRIIVAGENPAEIPLESENNLGRFEGQIPGGSTHQSFHYSIVAGDATRGPFEVVVRDEPTAMLESVAYVPHPYTRLPERTSSVGALDGVEGSRVTVTATSNRPVARGRIEFNPRTANGRTSATGGFAPLDIADDGKTVSATWNLRTGLRSPGGAAIDSYRLRIWDDTETSNSDPIVYPIRVQPDLAPEVRIAVPAEWPKEVPLGSQQLIEVRGLDPDFGLTSLRLQIRRGTLEVATPMLFESTTGLSGNQVALYRFRPDALGLHPGDVVTVRALATDNRTTIEGDRPDPNETASDPVELRIVAAPPRRSTVEDGDGLQPKDEQPAIAQNQKAPETPAADQPQPENPPNEPKAKESKTDSDKEKSGEEKSGEGQSGEEKSGEGQSGEGQSGEGQSGEGQSGEGQSGEGQSGEGQSGEGQSGEGQSGEGQSGEGPSGEGQSGEGQSGEGQSGEGQSGEGQSGMGEAGTEQSGTGEPGENPAGSSSTAEAGSDSGGASSSPAREPSGQGANTSDAQSAENPSPAGQSSGSQSSTGQSSTSQSSTSQSSTSQSSGSQSADGQAADDTPQRPASTDGEAFERIEDYLRKQEQSGNAQTPSAPPTGPSETPAGENAPGENAASENGPSENATPENATPENATPENATPENGASENGASESRPGTGEASPEPGSSAEPGAATETGGSAKPGASPKPDASADPGNGADPAGNGADSTGNGAEPGSDGEPGSSPQPDDSAERKGMSQPGVPEGGDSESSSDGPQAGTPSGSEASPQDAAPKAGEPKAGASGENASGESSSGESANGDKRPEGGDPRGGEPGQTPAGEPGKTSAGEPGKTSDKTPGKTPEQPSGEPSGRDAEPGSGKPSESAGADPGAASPGEPTSTTSTTSTTSPAGTGAPSGTTSGSMGGDNQGTSGAGEPAAAEPPPAPDPVNAEYARRATDLVLDALKNQRDTPDPKLLDELGWTPDQYRRFIDRWEKARRMAEGGDQAAKEEFDESLRSLGIRPPQTNRSRTLDNRSDELENLRDAGTRVPPPPQFREAFEAFRRTVNQP